MLNSQERHRQMEGGRWEMRCRSVTGMTDAGATKGLREGKASATRAPSIILIDPDLVHGRRCVGVLGVWGVKLHYRAASARTKLAFQPPTTVGKEDPRKEKKRKQRKEIWA